MSKASKYRSAEKLAAKKESLVEANPIWRFIAYIIDVVIIRFTFQGIVIALGYGGLFSKDLVRSVSLYLGEGIAPMRGGLSNFFFIDTIQDLTFHVIVSLYFLVYFIVLESEYGWGKTIGKKITGLEVTDDRGNKVSLRSSFLRNITKYIYRIPVLGIFFGIFDLILLNFHTDRTGDMIADTLVVSEKKD